MPPQPHRVHGPAWSAGCPGAVLVSPPFSAFLSAPRTKPGRVAFTGGRRLCPCGPGNTVDGGSPRNAERRHSVFSDLPGAWFLRVQTALCRRHRVPLGGTLTGTPEPGRVWGPPGPERSVQGLAWGGGGGRDGHLQSCGPSGLSVGSSPVLRNVTDTKGLWLPRVTWGRGARLCSGRRPRSPGGTRAFARLRWNSCPKAPSRLGDPCGPH